MGLGDCISDWAAGVYGHRSLCSLLFLFRADLLRFPICTPMHSVRNSLSSTLSLPFIAHRINVAAHKATRTEQRLWGSSAGMEKLRYFRFALYIPNYSHSGWYAACMAFHILFFGMNVNLNNPRLADHCPKRRVVKPYKPDRRKPQADQLLATHVLARTHAWTLVYHLHRSSLIILNYQASEPHYQSQCLL